MSRPARLSRVAPTIRPVAKVRRMPRPIAAHRHREILKRIETSAIVSVEELAGNFGVSRETIRRDLKALADRGHVDIVHGGAARREAREAALADRAGENAAGKAAIGRFAAGLVADGMVVLLDSGTTTKAVAEALSGRSDLTVCTTSLASALLLCRLPGTRVHLLGGEIDPNDESTTGLDVIASLARFRVDIAFVGAGGMSHDGEITDFTRSGAEQRAAMLEAAERSYFVADRTKFGRLTPIRIRGTERAAGVIVDTEPPPPLGAALARRGLQVLVAGSDLVTSPSRAGNRR